MCCPWIELKEDLTAVAEGAGETTSSIDIDIDIDIDTDIDRSIDMFLLSVCVTLDSQRALYWYTMNALHVPVRS
jgi:hypothetical protein